MQKAEAELDLSVIIITYNEEKTLKRTLESLPRGAEFVIVDSFSTDHTKEIGEKFGAKVLQQKFTNFSDQKNTALNLTTKKWIFSIDADETIDQNLYHFLISITSKPVENLDPAGYCIKRELVFMGKRMHFGKTRDYPLRLFRKDSGLFQGEIHEQVIIKDGQIARFNRGSIAHYSYDDLEDYFSKFNIYTSRVAEKHFHNEKKTKPNILHLLRPWSEFLVRYIIRGGFLDGYPGYCYALLSSFYMFVKYAKFRELYSLKREITS